MYTRNMNIHLIKLIYISDNTFISDNSTNAFILCRQEQYSTVTQVTRMRKYKAQKDNELSTCFTAVGQSISLTKYKTV